MTIRWRRPLAIAVVALPLLLAAVTLGSTTTYAQDPTPTHFMHNVTPTFTEPNDGASVLVVEGLGLGLGSTQCSNPVGLSLEDDLNNVVFISDTNVIAGRPTVTEISPQAPCDSNLQDWKNVILQIETRIENDTGSAAAAWWGGIMLDEESIAEFGFSASQYEDLNSSVRTLMATTQGIPWYYTETFSGFFNGQGDWSQSDFNAITGTSHAAPQMATNYMRSLTNSWQAATQETVLVTWGLGPGYSFHSLYRAVDPISGGPQVQWSLGLSNCFIGTICDDWDGDGIINSQDDDIDGDGYTNAQENALGKNPLVYCKIMRADLNGDGAVNTPQHLVLFSQWFTDPVPPAPAR